MTTRPLHHDPQAGPQGGGQALSRWSTLSTLAFVRPGSA